MPSEYRVVAVVSKVEVCGLVGSKEADRVVLRGCRIPWGTVPAVDDEHVEFVVTGREVRKGCGRYLCPHSKLFVEFPRQCVCGLFVLLNMSAGKIPDAGEPSTIGRPSAE